MFLLLEKVKFNKLLLLIVLVLFTISSCDDDEEVTDMMPVESPTVIEDNPTLFGEMQEALGGAENIANATLISYQATGLATEFQEDPEPIDGKVADYTYSLLYNLNGTQSKQSWEVDAEYGQWSSSPTWRCASNECRNRHPTQ